MPLSVLLYILTICKSFAPPSHLRAPRDGRALAPFLKLRASPAPSPSLALDRDLASNSTMPLKHKPLKLPLSAFSPQAAPIEPSNKATLDGHVDLDGLSKDLDFQAWEGKGRSISGGVAFSR